MNKIKIAYITKNLKLNGISTVLMNYCKYLNKDIFEITIFAGSPIAEKNREECNKNRITLIETPPKRGNNPLRYYYFLLKNISNKKFDIVHIHGNTSTIILELIIAKLKGIKLCITHAHSTTGDFKLFHKIMKKILCKLANVKLACGEKAGKWMYGNSKFSIIQNGFEIDRYRFNEYSRMKFRKKLNIEDKIVIGHIGTFTYEKNHEFIIDIFEKVAGLDEKYVLLLVGAGPKYKEIEDRINKSKFKERIILYGETNDVKPIYDAMDIFILPSRAEGLGIVLVEAQINGLSCISSDVIPDEAIISENLKRISLDEPEMWIEEILNLRKTTRAFNKVNIKKMNYFDIKESIKSLEKYYEIKESERKKNER